MKHARADYNRRIQDSENKIPEDMPVFLIIGSDVVGPSSVENWANEAEAIGASEHIVAAARQQAKEMRIYQEHHPELVKVPDMAREDVSVNIPDPTKNVSTINGFKFKCKNCGRVLFDVDMIDRSCTGCGRPLNWNVDVFFEE